MLLALACNPALGLRLAVVVCRCGHAPLPLAWPRVVWGRRHLGFLWQPPSSSEKGRENGQFLGPIGLFVCLPIAFSRVSSRF
ncbi:hypothetical protein FKM82_025828 [Ascaphus truei]